MRYEYYNKLTTKSLQPRHYATSRKVAGSISYEVILFLSRTMALGRVSVWQKWVPGAFLLSHDNSNILHQKVSAVIGIRRVA
jgi:hypothetical protein